MVVLCLLLMVCNEKFSDVTRRMIYEYHRIELDTEKIDNFSVIELIAQKTCISINSCEECMKVKLEYFNCSWCFSSNLDSNGPFCSDEQGLHRRRQEWIERKCDKQDSTAYCSQKQSDQAPAAAPSETTPAGENTTRAGTTHVNSATSKTAASNSSSDTRGHGVSAGGAFAIIMIVASLLAFIGWIFYAYFRPTTSSGQFLIRYRPSQWFRSGVPRDEVRLT